MGVQCYSDTIMQASSCQYQGNYRKWAYIATQIQLYKPHRVKIKEITNLKRSQMGVQSYSDTIMQNLTVSRSRKLQTRNDRKWAYSVTQIQLCKPHRVSIKEITANGRT